MAVLKVWNGTAWENAVTPAATAYGRATKSADQTINANTVTTIVWQTSTTYGSMGVNGTSGFTVNEGGLYEITASLTFRPPGSTGRSRLDVQRNGTDIFGKGLANVALDVVTPTIDASDIWFLTSGDSLTVTLWQTSSGNPAGTLTGAAVGTYFTVCKVGGNN